ncbi:F-box protein CPR1-like [Punica granatum]|uniref:F-box protein CPR1-like n=1 Tax=Punica granatum TaxID=22663 RepID=A0A6P8EBF6_PUNGR|nr:F-box protein CPR1-like [Punica granatum]
MEKVGEEGILIDILSRLPVKSLLRSKCVCKQWRSLISDPEFAELQLGRSKEHNPNACRRVLWLNNPIRSIDCESLSCSNEGTTVRDIKHPSIVSSLESFIEIVGSCNGLVCLLVDFKSFILWNPTTGACNELPSPSSDISGREYFYGFGYDSSTNHYKLFKGSSACYGFLSDNTIVEIYSCKTNSWRRMKYEFIPYVTSRGLFLNGSLHWLVGRDCSDLDSMIVSFDVADETFGRLVSPLLLDLDTVLEGLMILEDCLFVYQDNWTGFNSFTFEGWILRDYPVKSSWTKYCSFLIEESPAQHYLWDPLWFRKDGKVLFHLGHVANYF